MQSIRLINPMVRAIVVIGSVAALVGAVTFAALTSNTVAIGPNTITTGNAALQIAAGGNCETGTYGTSIPGFTVNDMTSSTDVTPLEFCLKNAGDVALGIFGSIPENVTTAVASGHITLSISCTSIGNQSDTLNTWFLAGNTFTDNPLNAGEAVGCSADLSLSSSYPGSGGETVPTFNIQFVGNETNPHA